MMSSVYFLLCNICYILSHLVASCNICSILLLDFYLSMKDITTPSDIHHLLNKFYEKAFADDIIGYIFKNAPGFILEEHLPVIASFWESVLFGVASYKGNPMLKHIELNRSIPLKAEHFERWLQLWEQTVKENFEGTIANDAVTKAKSIAYLMQQKIQLSNNQDKKRDLI